jgi:hypothetical protein
MGRISIRKGGRADAGVFSEKAARFSKYSYAFFEKLSWCGILSWSRDRTENRIPLFLITF